MDYCSNIEALKNSLISELNNSGLTIGAAYLVVKDVYNIMHLAYLEEIEREKKSKLTEQKEVIAQIEQEE